jgi:hypothetical protein
MLESLLGIIALISSVFSPAPVVGDSGTINQLNPWKVSGGYVQLSSTTASLKVPSLNCTSFTNGGALTADATGAISCSNDDGGGGASSGFIVNATGTPGQVAEFSALNTLRSTTSLNVASLNATSSASIAQLIVGSLSGVIKATAGLLSGGATTSDLPEGSNSYWTSARSTTSVSALIAGTTTTALAEGTNLYWTTARGTTTARNSIAGLYPATTTANTWTGAQTFQGSTTIAGIQSTALNCSALGNGGKLVANANGYIQCDADVGATTAASSTLLSDGNHWSAVQWFNGLVSLASSTIQTFFSTNATTSTFGLTGIGDGLLKTRSGSVVLATVGTDYEAGLTAGDGLTRTINDFDCDTASESVFGCLTSAFFSTFNNKVSSTSLRSGSLITYDSASGFITASTSPTFSTLNATSSLTIGTLSGVLKATAGLVSGGASTSDVPEGTNLYWTTARGTTTARNSIGGLYPATTTANTWTGDQTFTNASSTNFGVTGQFYVSGTASSTFAGGIQATNGRFSALNSCDTIDTDANGVMRCGTDSSGSTAGFIVNATGTPGQLAAFSAINAIVSTSTANVSSIDATSTTRASIFQTLSMTNGTSSTFAITNALSGLLKTDANGSVRVATDGTDYTLIDALTCTGNDKFSGVTAAGVFTCSTDQTGGGGGTWPWTVSTNYNVSTNATTTAYWAQGAFYASSTVKFGNSTTEGFSWDSTNLRLGIGSTTPGGTLAVGGRLIADHFIATSTTATSTVKWRLSVGTSTSNEINFMPDVVGTSTFTSGYGIDLTNGGCFAIAGTCVSGVLSVGGSNNDVMFRTGAQAISGSTGVSFAWDNTNKRLGIGTSTPYAQLSVGGEVWASGFRATSSDIVSLFKFASSTGFSADRLCIGTDCKTAWPSSGATTTIYADNNHFTAVQFFDGGFIARASSTVQSLCINSDCRTSWPSGGSPVGGAGSIQYTNGSAFNGRTQFFIDNTNLFMGIGTTTPMATLSITGTTTQTIFAVASSTADRTSIKVDNLGDTYLGYGPSAVATVKAGMFGVGTTTPGAMFSVSGKAVFSDGDVWFGSALNGTRWDNTNRRLSVGTSTSLHRATISGRIWGQPMFECLVPAITGTAVVADGLGNATIPPIMCGTQMGFDMNGTTDGRIPVTEPFVIASGTPAVTSFDSAYTASNNGDEGIHVKSASLIGSATSSMGEGIAMEIWYQTPNAGTATTSAINFMGFSNVVWTGTTTSAAHSQTEGCLIAATSTANWQAYCITGTLGSKTIRGVDTGIATSTQVTKFLLVLDQTGFSVYTNGNTTAHATVPFANVPSNHLRAVFGAGALQTCSAVSGGAVTSTQCGISTAKGTGLMRVGPIKVWGGELR